MRYSLPEKILLDWEEEFENELFDRSLKLCKQVFKYVSTLVHTIQQNTLQQVIHHTTFYLEDPRGY